MRCLFKAHETAALACHDWPNLVGLSLCSLELWIQALGMLVNPPPSPPNILEKILKKQYLREVHDICAVTGMVLRLIIKKTVQGGLHLK
jgi:hypothetical protein